MGSRSLRIFILTFPFATLLACGREEPAAKPPAPIASAASAESSAAPASASVAPVASSSAPAASASAPARKSIKETIGTVTKIEVSGKTKIELTRQADVAALLAAIGTDQVPSGVRRRCPDDVVVTMKDASGKETGNVGLCIAEALGPEFFTGAGDRKGITLADEAAVRKALKLEAPKPSAKPSSSAAPKK